ELGDREEKLRGGPEAARHRDQELDLLLRPVVLLAEERRHAAHPLRGRTVRIVEEVRDELVRHHAEHVRDGRLVAPEPGPGRPPPYGRSAAISAASHPPIDSPTT